MLAAQSKLAVAVAAVLGLSLPASAQSGLCAGLGDDAPWLGQSEAGSDIATAPAPFVWAGAVAPSMREVALFSLSAPMAIRVEAAADDPLGDPLIELFDASGRLVVIDDDAGGGRSARAEPRLEPGVYCVAMMGFGGAPVQGRMQVSRLEMAALTPGLAGGFAGTEDRAPFVGIPPCDLSTPARLLAQGAPIDAALAGGLSETLIPAETGYLRFHLAGDQPLSIRAENVDADPYLYVFDAHGRLLGENDDFDGLNSRVDFAEPLAAGAYCIGLRALWDAMVPITVTIGAPDAVANASRAYRAGQIAPPLDGSWPVEDLGILPPKISRDWTVSGDQAQWFVMEVPRAGLLRITADALDGSDPVLAIFEASGVLLARNDDAGDTRNAAVAVDVMPGRYLVALSQFNVDETGLIRIGIARYVPALP